MRRDRRPGRRSARAEHTRPGLSPFGFGPDDDLLYLGTPPAYGPDDDALAAPTIGALRKSCWDGPESGGSAAERRYVECVTKRFAVWGLQ